MTSFSKGIMRPEMAGNLQLSEVPLEVFTVPEKKKADHQPSAKTEPADDLHETEAADGSEQQKEQTKHDPETEAQIHAEFLMEQARRHADALLKEAQREAENIRALAEKEGYTEGWNHGCTEGREKALEEGRQQREIQRQEFQESLTQALESIEKEKNVCLKRYLDQLKDLAVAVGEKVIRISLKSNGDVIRRMIEAETEKMKKKAWVRIYMEHDDYETMIQADGEVVSHLTRLSDNVKFVVMEQSTGGSCIIEMPDEIIDMSVDTQMENIRKLVGDVRF